MAAQTLHLSQPFVWEMPVAVRFGMDAAQAVVEAASGTPIVLLTYAGAHRHEAPSNLIRQLGGRVLDVVEVPDGLASIAMARALSQKVWPVLATHPQAILLAVGGGSALDMAKLLRCRPLDGDFETLVPALRAEFRWPAMTLARLWLIPTTAGTGSEVTRWATVWDTESEVALKRSFDEPHGFAERAFVDPTFTLSCPAPVVRDSALDALSHALEALWNRHANPVSDALAVSAARRVISSLPRAQAQPDDIEARGELSLAALEAGLAFSQTRTALAHALSYALTLEAGTPHGLACAVWLPTAWQLAVGLDRRLDHHLERVFDAPAAEGVLHLIGWLRAAGVDPRPEAQGVRDADVRIAQALSSARGRNFITAVG